MTDRELIELAATAAGIVHEGWCSDTDLRCGLFIPMGHRTDALRPLWNPLANDGDAFRLALRLPLDICRTDAEYAAVCVWVDHRGYFIEEPHNGDPCAATRRAIVRAAAEIGKAMP